MIEMSDDQKREFFEGFHKQWIEPEIKRRFEESGIPDSFKLRECLITFPKNKLPQIHFNDEFGWHVEPVTSSDETRLPDLVVGEPVHLHQIVGINSVLPPTVDGERVAFIFLFWNGFDYSLFIDFNPNQLDFDALDDRFAFRGEIIAQHLQNALTDKVVQWAKKHEVAIHQIGLWIATSLLPYPLSKIVERVSAGDIEGARRPLIDFCTPDFIYNKLVKTWSPINAFHIREKLFEEAFEAHRLGLFHLSISAMIGPVEGVIVDWLHEIMPPDNVPWRTPSRLRQLDSNLQQIPQLHYAFREALNATIGFLQNDGNSAGPFQLFNDWLMDVDPNFPPRHMISHGRYASEIYTEENSIKLFLLLDTLCQFMMFYEVRVLGRNLGQNG
ncbi:MAG: hypothetical protein KME04_16280 [Pleurocapsa minor GSE-CHR-MK-17-07R]|jgi:hypothetical protein|nr:hypothetical protein [Pleurocapsa minor GSE-CHR-MK 17-07R]